METNRPGNGHFGVVVDDLEATVKRLQEYGGSSSQRGLSPFPPVPTREPRSCTCGIPTASLSSCSSIQRSDLSYLQNPGPLGSGFSNWRVRAGGADIPGLLAIWRVRSEEDRLLLREWDKEMTRRKPSTRRPRVDFRLAASWTVRWDVGAQAKGSLPTIQKPLQFAESPN